MERFSSRTQLRACPEAAPECKVGYENFEIMVCPMVSLSTLSSSTQGNKDCNGDPTEMLFHNQPCPEAALERKVKHRQTLTRSGVIHHPTISYDKSNKRTPQPNKAEKEK